MFHAVPDPRSGRSGHHCYRQSLDSRTSASNRVQDAMPAMQRARGDLCGRVGWVWYTTRAALICRLSQLPLSCKHVAARLLRLRMYIIVPFVSLPSVECKALEPSRLGTCTCLGACVRTRPRKTAFRGMAGRFALRPRYCTTDQNQDIDRLSIGLVRGPGLSCLTKNYNVPL